MIYRYNAKEFIDFAKVESMKFVEGRCGGDATLELVIYMDSGSIRRISEVEKTIHVASNGTFKKSLYPLLKLRQVANAWLKWKNNQTVVIERTITKTGNTEVIREKMVYNPKG